MYAPFQPASILQLYDQFVIEPANGQSIVLPHEVIPVQQQICVSTEPGYGKIVDQGCLYGYTNAWDLSHVVLRWAGRTATPRRVVTKDWRLCESCCQGDRVRA